MLLWESMAERGVPVLLLSGPLRGRIVLPLAEAHDWQVDVYVLGKEVHALLSGFTEVEEI
jgi:hypothetical protein